MPPSPTPTYAAKTKVPVSQSRSEIEQTLRRYGADAFGYGQDGNRAVVTFRLAGRMMRIAIDVPEDPQHERARWRSLGLIIKAKCEAVDAGIETVEQAWMPYVLLPNGTTVGDFMAPQIQRAYDVGEMPALLPGLNA
jgi:hypothetical protein